MVISILKILVTYSSRSRWCASPYIRVLRVGPVLKKLFFLFRKPGQQYEDVEDIVERARSRAASRAQDIVEESPREAEVRGQNIANNNNSYSPSRKYSVDDNIQASLVVEFNDIC